MLASPSVTHSLPDPPYLPDLADLAKRLDAGLSSSDDRAGSWLVKMTAEPGGQGATELSVLPVDEGRHPLDMLLGMQAEPTWVAFGVVCHGTALRLNDQSPDAGKSSDSGEFPVRAILLVGRDGTEASVVRPLHGGRPIEPPEPGEGRMGEACRRAMGLPTLPPPSSPVAWLASVWLDTIMATVSGEPSTIHTWADAARLHPCVTGRTPQSPDALIRLAAGCEGSTSWKDLRTLASEGNGGWHQGLIPIAPALAGWMDDGMFARWLLAEFPDPLDLLIDLVGLVPTAVGHGLVEAALGWGLW